MTPTEILIRPAYPDDREALERLAVLDSAEPLAGRVLVAEVGNEIRAALATESGAAIGDPFTSTAHLVSLLRTHAGHARRSTYTRRRVRGVLPLAGRRALRPLRAGHAR